MAENTLKTGISSNKFVRTSHHPNVSSEYYFDTILIDVEKRKSSQWIGKKLVLIMVKNT